MSNRLRANPGSFRDPANRVYEIQFGGSQTPRILRGLDEQALKNYNALAKERFFNKCVTSGRVVNTQRLDDLDEGAQCVLADGWAGVLEHETIPFVTYPY